MSQWVENECESDLDEVVVLSVHTHEKDISSIFLLFIFAKSVTSEKIENRRFEFTNITRFNRRFRKFTFLDRAFDVDFD